MILTVIEAQCQMLLQTVRSLEGYRELLRNFLQTTEDTGDVEILYAALFNTV